ncbi:MAG TPA: ribonuclease H-like domain-containing protein [Bryobacterales bacterium]|nr:ribonuclease H-like domain-containing protein [Bryobacterales bacterium]
MTSDLKSQLALLRRRITRINRKYQGGPAGTSPPGSLDGTFALYGGSDAFSPGDSACEPEIYAPVRYSPEKFVPGSVVENEQGRYFLAEKFFPSHRHHGGIEFSRLNELAGELLPAISPDDLPACAPGRWAFLDTETTGLSAGTGTCAFLIGVGTIEPAGFRVRLFFMRDYDEEAAMLAGLASLLSRFEVLITYNGKAYDAPLLESRYCLRRMASPLSRLAHLDLLFAARRLWRLRLESCRLIQLENEILGVERQGDLLGEMIPYHYFEYLRTRQAFRLAPLFHHNTMDIVSLAALTAIVLPAFAAPEGSGLRHGEDLLGLARWLRQNGRLPEAVTLYRRAIQRGLSDRDLFSALWEMAILEKKSGHRDRAVAIWSDLAFTQNAFRSAALEELAKYYEHTERNYSLALEMTAAALALAPAPALERRQRRLKRKAAEQSRPLLR